MHIKPGEQSQFGGGRQNESSSGRKLRLGGGASRVPVQTKAADSPLQVLVSAIGQSFGAKPQVRAHTVGSKEQSVAKGSLFTPVSKTSHGTSSTPQTESKSSASSSLFGRTRTREPAGITASRSTLASSVRTPTTPAVSRVASTPSSATRVPSTPSTSRVPSTPSTSRGPSTPSISRIPSTPSTSRIPSTPSVSRIPSTPSASRIPSTPSMSRIPSTPSASRLPLTPTSSRAAATPTLTKVPSTPASSRTYYTPASSRVPSTPASKVSSTPSSTSRLHGAAERSSRHTSLSSSSSSSLSSSTSGKVSRHSQASSVQHANTSVRKSVSARSGNPTTPVSKNVSVLSLRTPKAQNDPITPASKISSILTPRRPSVTPGQASKQQSDIQSGHRGAIPITPVSKQIAVTPGTPIHGVQNEVSTPYSDRSTTAAFYTPSSTLPLTPLQSKNFNIIESSRKLHFGAEGVAAGDQENLGCLTPKPYDSAATNEPTFTFDKNRLAQIRARRSSSQLLKSPAQRVIRVLDSRPAYTPARGLQSLQQVDEDRSARFDDDDGRGGFFQALPNTPGRRRLANSLF